MTDIIMTVILECLCGQVDNVGGKGESHVISQWKQFTIWNAGKEGCHFYRSLSHDDQQKVMFTVTGSCDALSVYHITGGGIL